ncbi:uncharacterized protein PGTG_02504 [Puccinia graminis f. sp. tritici CRL 75-36-700-3]|uniref:Uncharacterized protein n=1 Tax=Puccinia graminis f. sp. tritici (strain CRL 75-36-700-3 / race SCCL) TaxID=418459 RepID=E3JVI8_PUCGT|nr:uncharacterized protein PGTG_02504 [Puccinia graminis f. sp. tritici CRL 75-36-700-3]EFP76063.1 hypothetical protein PGTG_02504 [Puccinia graminis f. sp. tritici CRL 75-36-700-3]
MPWSHPLDQESTTAPTLPQHAEAKEGEEEDLEVAVNAAPKAFQGEKPLSAGQLNAIDLLQKSKQIYFNAKSAEEYELLPHLVKQTIETFRLVRSFLTWQETLAKLDGWNPYKEKAAAALWEKFKKNPAAANSNSAAASTSAIPANSDRFRGYKIPKNAKGKAATNVKNNKFMTSVNKREMEKRKWKKVTHLAQAMIEFRDAANL